MTSGRNFSSAMLAVAAGVVALTGAATAQTTPAAPAPPVAAVVNPCTSVDEAKCPTVAGCVWLPGYKIKGAPDVVGYCRTAPKPLTARQPGGPAAPVKQ